jgi:hypothetical protein
MGDFGTHTRARRRLGAAGVTGAIALAAFAGVGGAAPSSQAAPPANTSRPTISGEAREGQTLTATTGSWRNNPTSFSFQWIRCSVRLSNCVNIPGATRNTYRLASADVGRRLLVSVRAVNRDGDARAQSNATAEIARRANAPANVSPPTIAGTPQEGQTLTVSSNGAWTGTAPISFSYQWLRCDRTGGACASIVGATAAQYQLTTADVNNTVRVTVTGRNTAGATSATSVPSAVVSPARPPGPAGQIRLPDGRISIPVSSVEAPTRLVIGEVRFSPNPASRRSTLVARIRISDTRGLVVRGALVYIRSVPLQTSTPPETPTGQDGTVTLELVPRPGLFPLRRGFNVQFFVRARKAGDSALAGVSARRLVQVRTR